MKEFKTTFGLSASALCAWILCSIQALASTPPSQAQTASSQPINQGPLRGVTSLARLGVPAHQDFNHLPYVNPSAPKGGLLRLGTLGTFDSLNKDAIKGVAAFGLEWMFDPLMQRSSDEPFTVYGVLARSVELAKDHSSLVIHLDQRARFHDGSPVTAQDVAFTYKVLQGHGFWPRYRQFYSKIKTIDILNTHTLKLTFVPGENGEYDPELPLLVSLVRVLCKKNIESLSSFENSGLVPLVGSGPYKIASVQQGRTIVYERDPNYWAKDLPVNVGYYNFDKVQVDYFKTLQAHFLAFQAGEIDLYFETNPTQWLLGYNFKAVTSGEVLKFEHKHERPTPVQTIIYNMHRPVFSDWRVRKALSLAFDFNTLNKIVFQGKMTCPHSLFENTHLAHQGKAAGEERELLSKLCKDEKLKQIMLDHAFSPVPTKGDGDQREALVEADKLLKEAGCNVINSIRMTPSGEPLTLEFMIKDPKFEKIALAFGNSLKRLGIRLNVKMMDTVQYENRVTERDFDMIIHTWSNSLSPGNEQIYYFSVKNATIKGSSNYIGMSDPVAEELARLLTVSKTPEELKNRAHALDRYVMHQVYMIPLSCNPTLCFAYRKKNFACPPMNPKVGMAVTMAWKP